MFTSMAEASDTSAMLVESIRTENRSRMKSEALDSLSGIRCPSLYVELYLLKVSKGIKNILAIMDNIYRYLPIIIPIIFKKKTVMLNLTYLTQSSLK